MRENGIIVEGKRKFKATTDSDRTFDIAQTLLERDFTSDPRGLASAMGLGPVAAPWRS